MHNAKLPNIASSHRDDISRFLTSAKMVKEKLTGAIADNNTAFERMEVCEETVSKTIRETFKKLYQTLEDRMNEMLRELHEDSLSKKTALGLQNENFEALKQHLSHCTSIASSVLPFTDWEIIALKQLPSTELEASINKVVKMSLIPCENSDIKTALQLDLYHKNVLEVFSLFDSVCPERCNWKVLTSCPVINGNFSVVVEAKDSKERLYHCNDIQVKAELALIYTQWQLAQISNRFSSPPPPSSRIAAPSGLPSIGNMGPSLLGSQGAQSTTQIGQVSSNSNGTYTITFTPYTAGLYELSVTVNGQHIKDSPKSVTVDR